MKRAFTLIEVIVVLAIILILGAILFGSGCNSSMGRNLEIVSQENMGLGVKRHWRDRNTGECFYTLGESAQGSIYPEPCQ